MKDWLMAARPKTLTAALVPIVAGTGLVAALGFPVLWWVSALALASSFFIQVGTNLVNDAVDFKKGADTETRIGPRRVTQSGIFSYRKVMIAAAICFVLALFCGLPLVVQGGWTIVAIGLFSIVMGYAYTAGPFPLAYLGLGDLFVILFFGLVAVGGLVFLQTGRWSPEAVVLGLQIGLHCAVLIAINNLRDVEGDTLVEKKTLPVRFGQSFARWEILSLCLVPFVLNFYWWILGFRVAAGLSLLALPAAINIIRLIFVTEPSPAYNRFLAKAAGLHLIFGVLLAVGFFLKAVL